ncbi:MAG: hypothetical protein SWK90_07735 [Chloroflexota bacterium]|nr:hypothetical protein [Chloroflexota bacterium]
MKRVWDRGKSITEPETPAMEGISTAGVLWMVSDWSNLLTYLHHATISI